MIVKLIPLISALLGMLTPLLNEYVGSSAAMSALVGCLFSCGYTLLLYLNGEYTK